MFRKQILFRTNYSSIFLRKFRIWPFFQLFTWFEFDFSGRENEIRERFRAHGNTFILRGLPRCGSISVGLVSAVEWATIPRRLHRRTVMTQTASPDPLLNVKHFSAECNVGQVFLCQVRRHARHLGRALLIFLETHVSPNKELTATWCKRARIKHRLLRWTLHPRFTSMRHRNWGYCARLRTC